MGIQRGFPHSGKSPMMTNSVVPIPNEARARAIRGKGMVDPEGRARREDTKKTGTKRPCWPFHSSSALQHNNGSVNNTAMQIGQLHSRFGDKRVSESAVMLKHYFHYIDITDHLLRGC